jgi:hypothetical protein
MGRSPFKFQTGNETSFVKMRNLGDAVSDISSDCSVGWNEKPELDSQKLFSKASGPVLGPIESPIS